MKRTRYPGVHRLLDGRHRIRVKVRDPKTGKNRTVLRVVNAKSAAEAAAIRERLREEIRRGGAGREDRVRTGDAATSWLRSNLPKWKTSTREQNALVLDEHVIPTLGDCYLDALVPADIIRWRDQQKGAPATVNGRLRVLKQMLADVCHEHGLRNPAERVASIREPHVEEFDNTLEPEELTALLDALSRHHPRWYALFATLAFTGARFGEVTALKWSDIDFEAGVIRIRRSQWRGHVDETKTGIRRTVPMPAELAAALTEHRRAQVGAQEPGLARGWVFPSRKGTLLFSGGSVRKPLHAALKTAGIRRRFTPHGFRHTWNNLVRRAAGTHVAQALVGHATDEMTEHYSHVALHERRQAVAKVLSVVRGDRSGDRSPAQNDNDRSAVGR